MVVDGEQYRSASERRGIARHRGGWSGQRTGRHAGHGVRQFNVTDGATNSMTATSLLAEQDIQQYPLLGQDENEVQVPEEVQNDLP